MKNTVRMVAQSFGRVSYRKRYIKKYYFGIQKTLFLFYAICKKNVIEKRKLGFMFNLLNSLKTPGSFMNDIVTSTTPTAPC